MTAESIIQNMKAALFDLDGTLFDTEGEYTIYWGGVCRRYRPDIERLEYKIKGMTLQQIFEQYFPDPELQKVIQQGLDEYESHMQYRWLPGALEFVQQCRERGVKCLIVTSSNQVKMSAVRAKMPDFDQLFDRVLTSEDFTASKPAPDCYLQAARLSGCAREDCVVFEDAVNGLKAGTSAGIYTVGVATYNSPELIAPLCDHVIADFTELLSH